MIIATAISITEKEEKTHRRQHSYQQHSTKEEEEKMGETIF
jgi:hypothetical protein